MAKQRYTTEEIIHKLREADVLIGQGQTIAQVTKQIGVTEQTYFRWRKSHGGLRIDQAKRLRELEAENSRLKRAVADLTVDKIILKEVAEGKFEARCAVVRPWLGCDLSIGTPSDGSAGRWALPDPW